MEKKWYKAESVEDKLDASTSECKSWWSGLMLVAVSSDKSFGSSIAKGLGLILYITYSI